MSVLHPFYTKPDVMVPTGAAWARCWSMHAFVVARQTRCSASACLLASWPVPRACDPISGQGAVAGPSGRMACHIQHSIRQRPPEEPPRVDRQGAARYPGAAHRRSPRRRLRVLHAQGVRGRDPRHGAGRRPAPAPDFDADRLIARLRELGEDVGGRDQALCLLLGVMSDGPRSGPPAEPDAALARRCLRSPKQASGGRPARSSARPRRPGRSRNVTKYICINVYIHAYCSRHDLQIR